jgi:hypothetical protein
MHYWSLTYLQILQQLDNYQIPKELNEIVDCLYFVNDLANFKKELVSMRSDELCNSYSVILNKIFVNKSE